MFMIVDPEAPPPSFFPPPLISLPLTNKIIDFHNGGHKPGFLGQAQDFMNFCLGREDCIGADIMDAYSALKLAQSLVK